MRNKWKILLLLAVLLAGIFSGTSFQVSHAQTGSGFDLTWNVIGGGGGSGESSGSGFSVLGTIGQTAISSSQGSGFSLEHGFWNRIMVPLKVFLTLIIR